MTKAGAWSKLAALESRLVHEYGLAYSLRLDVPAHTRAAAVVYARKRFPHLRGAHLRASATRPPKRATALVWLRSVFVTSRHRHREGLDGRVWLPETLVSSSRGIVAGPLWAQWVDMWSEARCRVEYTGALGFGLRAMVDIRTGTRVALGVREEDVEDPAAIVLFYDPSQVAGNGM